MSPSLLAAVALAIAPPAEPAPLPTAAELATDLARVRAAVREVHVVVQDRGQSYSAPDVPIGPTIYRWGELFLSNDAAQGLMDWSNPPLGATDWWYSVAPSGVPLTGETAADHAMSHLGRIICLRAPGNGPVRAQLLDGLADQSGMLSDELYTTHADVEPFNPPAPHVFAGRAWSEEAGAGSLIDQFAETDRSDWVVEGREVKDGRPAVRVLVVTNGPHPQPSQTYEGVLDRSSGLRAWFTDDDRHDLFRVETVHRLRYDGREIPSVDADGAPSPPHRVVTADDFRTLVTAAGEVRVPFAGRDEYHSPVPAAEGEEPSTWAGPDPLIEEFLRTGRVADKGVWFVSMSQEWRITTLEPLDPAITAEDLWVEPQDGAQVHDVTTGKESIAGLSFLESWLIVTFRSRNAVWWAFGPPLALCGVLAAAWWWRRRQRRWANA